MAKTVVNLSDSMAQFVVKANQISTHVGDTLTLTTTNDSDLVGAINEIELNHNNLDSNVGTLASLTTDDKSDLVSAINEVKASAVATDSSLSGFIRSDQADTKTAGDLTFVDNVKAVFGDASDLQIYHDGFHSYVSDAGTGNLQLSTNGTAIKMLRGNGEVLGNFNIGGSVDLYHNNVKKFETTATGVDVTGTTQTDTLQLDVASIPTWDTNTRLFTESGFGARYDGYQHRFDVGVSRTEAMRIDASGNIGFGTAPGNEMHLYRGSGSPAFRIQSSGGNAYMINRPGTLTMELLNSMNGPMTFFTNNGERARITADGKLLLGTTSVTSGILNAVYSGTYGVDLRGPSGASTLQLFFAGATNVGSISTNGASTTYNTASDKRLKENIETLENGTELLKAMRAVTYNWKVDGSSDVGFIAQEVNKVVPQAVSEGDDGMLSMDYGRITPIIVAALNDALKRIDELESKQCSCGGCN